MPAPNQKMVFGSVRFLIVWLCSVFALLGLGFAEAFVSNPVTLFQTKKIGLSYTNPRVLPLHSMYSLQMSSPAEATPSFGSGDKNSPSQGEILKSYPSSNGRESGWRFDLGHVDVKPGFVSVPPTPGAGGEALKKLSTADLRHGESNEKTNTETSRSKPLFSRQDFPFLSSADLHACLKLTSKRQAAPNAKRNERQKANLAHAHSFSADLCGPSRVAQAGLMFLTAGMMLIGLSPTAPQAYSRSVCAPCCCFGRTQLQETAF
eukprot:3143184-Rhodomonas_salina.2